MSTYTIVETRMNTRFLPGQTPLTNTQVLVTMGAGVKNVFSEIVAKTVKTPDRKITEIRTEKILCLRDSQNLHDY